MTIWGRKNPTHKATDIKKAHYNTTTTTVTSKTIQLRQQRHPLAEEELHDYTPLATLAILW
jgi:hypothetical protein